MTIITETRWKCDYCGCVSPVLVPTGEFSGHEMPKGWNKFIDRHFCCGLHEVYYHNRRAESAKTPEVTA